MEMKETFPEIWKRLEEIHYQQDFKKETSPPLFTLENKGHTK
ncbi:MAG: hypothetical protein SP1CHLAM9_03300 [Chlamydiia bacterium]|nr:hypothetical protein [Chlamydiia bacterium]MCH9624102.1 hypothetical protein [Chlamydiia bacterium]